MTDELPQGWAVTELQQLVIHVQPGFACGEHNQDGDGIGHIRPMNISEEGHIDFAILRYVPKDRVHCDERLVREGDVIFNNTNSPELVGKTALYNLPEPRAFSNHMTRIRCCPEGLDPKFCAMYLHQQWRSGYFASICNNHVSQASVASSVLLNTPVPLPPLTEQTRIVAKVEALLARVNAGRERLAKVPALLKRFRQSVLAVACSGQLTADWREENPNVGSAKEQIRDERFALSESEEGLPELPATWVWVPLGNHARCFRGKFTPRPRNDPRYFSGKHPFIQIGNLPRDGGFVTSHTQTLNEDGLAVSRKFPKGTTVIAIVDATIGNTGVLAYDMCVTDSIVGMETGTPEGNRYVELFLRHKKYNIRQSSYASGGQPNIKLEFLNPYSLALPPLTEQAEIVRHVEALFALGDKIEARVQAATARVEKITQAILAKAFRGELVPTEAELARQEGRDYEPASVLLERIRTARAANMKTKAGSRSPGRRTKGEG